jgi:uncharacterized membrane protein YhaH (DUF805 family)
LSWRDFLWSWNGRLNRLQCLLGVYCLGFLSTVAMFVVAPLFSDLASISGGAIQILALAIFLPTVVALPFQASMVVRRAHDHGRSARVVLAWLFAAVVVAMLAETPMIRGTALEVFLVLPIPLALFGIILATGHAQANAYGPPPARGWWP